MATQPVQRSAIAFPVLTWKSILGIAIAVVMVLDFFALIHLGGNRVEDVIGFALGVMLI